MISQALNSEAVFEGPDAVAGYGELRVLSVFECEDDFAGEPGIDFVNPVDIDQCRAVDAEEFRGIETVLEIGDGLVNAMRRPLMTAKVSLSWAMKCVTSSSVGTRCVRRRGMRCEWDSVRGLRAGMRSTLSTIAVERGSVASPVWRRGGGGQVS